MLHVVVISDGSWFRVLMFFLVHILHNQHLKKQNKKQTGQFSEEQNRIYKFLQELLPLVLSVTHIGKALRHNIHLKYIEYDICATFRALEVLQNPPTMVREYFIIVQYYHEFSDVNIVGYVTLPILLTQDM